MHSFAVIARILRFFVFLVLTAMLFEVSVGPLHAQSPIFPTNPTSPFPALPIVDHGDNNPNVYVCMGDSITRGSDLNDASQTYPARLQALLGQAVINEGIDGSRSWEGAARVERVLNRYKPGYLLTLYGVNDIGERTNDAIINSLRQIIQAAKNNKTIPVIATLTPVFGPRGWKESALRDLNNRIRIMADEEAILLVDLEEAFGWNPSYILPDGLHPNSSGHELMAQTFYETLQPSQQGGGGCTIKPQAKVGFEWVLLLGVLLLKITGIFPSRVRPRGM